ncbi:MAG: peptide-methionine (S)-S-oxide reductase [Patescibacteria group bacterium]
MESKHEIAGVRPNPTYDQVCTGVTDHAEVIQITFDTNRKQPYC